MNMNRQLGPAIPLVGQQFQKPLRKAIHVPEMVTQRGGGPAFPRPVSVLDTPDQAILFDGQEGATVFDLLQAAAIQGLASSFEGEWSEAEIMGLCEKSVQVAGTALAMRNHFLAGGGTEPEGEAAPEETPKEAAEPV